MQTPSLRIAILLLGLMIGGGALLAQAQTPAAPDSAVASTPLSQRLTPEQRQKMQQIRNSARDQAAVIRNDQSLTAEQKQEKLAALRNSTRDQMQSILTPEQQQAMAARSAQRAQQMSARLNLTADQQSKLAALRTDTHSQRQKVLADPSLTSEQKQQQLAQIRQNHDTQLASILTPEQFAQWQKMRQSRRGPRL